MICGQDPANSLPQHSRRRISADSRLARSNSSDAIWQNSGSCAGSGGWRRSLERERMLLRTISAARGATRRFHSHPRQNLCSRHR